MGMQRTGHTFAQTAKLKLQLDAELPYEKFVRLCESIPKFKATYGRRRRVKDWSVGAYEAALANFAVADDWMDQEIANLLIAFRRKHSERPEPSQDHFLSIIETARKEYERSRAIEALGNDDATEKEKLQGISTAIGLEIASIKRYLTDSPRLCALARSWKTNSIE